MSFFSGFQEFFEPGDDLFMCVFKDIMPSLRKPMHHGLRPNSPPLGKKVIIEDIHKLDLAYRVGCTLVAQIYNLRTGEVVFESLDEKEARKTFEFMRGEDDRA